MHRVILFLAAANAALGILLSIVWMRTQSLGFEIIEARRTATEAQQQLKNIEADTKKFSVQRDVMNRALSEYADAIDRLDSLVNDYDKAFSSSLEALDDARLGSPVPADDIQTFQETRAKLLERYEATFASSSNGGI